MRFVLPTLALIAIAACGSQDNTPDATKTGPLEEATLSFIDVQPILDAKCVGCHGDNDPKEGLALNTHAAVMQGGEHGAVVVPGDPKGSKLVQFIDGSKTPRMPFKQDPLSQEEIDKIAMWIEQGAKE
jgi:uncharacterized membrane protein